MKTKLTLSILTSIAIIFPGCGGEESNTGSNDNGRSGNVGDGYIQGAYVCHDTDNDMDCLDEIYATTDANGAFNLSNYDASQDLLVQIPVGAVDNGPFADGSTTPRPFTQETWYYYPAQAAPANGPIFIGPLSTLVYAQTQNVPGISIDDAGNAVAASLGIQGSSILDNYLEDNTPQGAQTHFAAELTGATLANYPSSVTPGNYADYLQNVLANSSNIGVTATSNNPVSYNTANYNGANVSGQPTQGAIALMYTPVDDVCADLQNGTYFALEDWDSTINPSLDREHKTLYTKIDPSTGATTLEYQWLEENSNAWSINTTHTSTENDYLQDWENVVIDMDHVNDPAANYFTVTHMIPFPALNTGCNGSNASFSIGGMKYKLYISSLDLNGVNGAQIPQGPTVGPLLNNVTFAAGDKLYKAIFVLENDTYSVKKGQTIQGGTAVPSPTSDYLVRDGSLAMLPDSTNLATLAQSTSTLFYLNYVDANNHEVVQITSPIITSGGSGTVSVTKYSGGTAQPVTTHPCVLETHNGYTYFVVKNYYGMGTHLFIGKVDAVDPSNLVFGSITQAGKSNYLTEGGWQNGDVMDDVMLNASARNRVINQYNIQNSLSIPIPPLP